MSGSTKRRTLALAGVAVLAVVVVLVSGFAYSVTVTQAVTSPTTTVLTSYQVNQVVTIGTSTQLIVGTYVSSSASTYQTSSVSYATIAEQTSTNQQVFGIGSTTLQPNYY